MSQYEVHVWPDPAAEPEVTGYEVLEDARAAFKQALATREPSRIDVVNPDGIVIESAER